MAKEDKVTEISKDAISDFDRLRDWITASNAPQDVKNAFNKLSSFVEISLKLCDANKRLRQRLLEAMGLAPTSEKGSNPDADQTDKNKKKDCDADCDSASKTPLEPDPIDPEVSQAARTLAKHREKMAQFRKDNNEPETDTLEPEKDTLRRLVASNEATIQFPLTEHRSEERTLRVTNEDKLAVFNRAHGLHSSYDQTTRYEYTIVRTAVTLRVETVRDPLTGKSVRADSASLGPQNSQQTWKGLATLVTLVTMMGLPIERVAKLFDFSSSAATYKQLKKMAELMTPIYLHLAKNLVQASHLWCDDTATRTLEVEKSRNKEAAQGPPLTQKPQEISDKPKDQPEGLEQIRQELWPDDNHINTKSKNPRAKVSLLHGRVDNKDEQSHIFFFCGHGQNCRRLLDRLLSWRRPDAGPLVIQSDMSLETWPTPNKNVEVQRSKSGCLAHARRPFFRYRNDYPDLCTPFLKIFEAIYGVEAYIKEAPRSDAFIVNARQTLAAPLLSALRDEATGLLAKFSSQTQKPTKIIAAANYILRHYDALTSYLSDPMLHADNNICERLLCAEKSLLKIGKFRRTIDGRLVLDVNRTICQTAQAAGVKIDEYFEFIGSASPSDIRKDPGRYTPHAFALAIKAKESRSPSAA